MDLLAVYNVNEFVCNISLDKPCTLGCLITRHTTDNQSYDDILCN